MGSRRPGSSFRITSCLAKQLYHGSLYLEGTDMEGISQIPWVLSLATLAKCPYRHDSWLIVCGNNISSYKACYQAAHGTGVLRDMKRCGDETQDKANPLVNLVDGLGLIGTLSRCFSRYLCRERPSLVFAQLTLQAELLPVCEKMLKKL